MSDKYENLETQHNSAKNLGLLGIVTLAYQSIGVIYGDIGTNPLFVFSALFTKPPTEVETMGAVSLIIWSLTLVMVIKYVMIILWADDHGEGGTFALYSLLCRGLGISPTGRPRVDFVTASSRPSPVPVESRIKESKTLQTLLALVVLFGASSIVGDGVLTPAISVLAAMEGIKVAVPSLEAAVVPLTCVILLLLFVMQHRGTSALSHVFAPVLLLWLFSLFSIGIYNLTFEPRIVQALSPHKAVEYFIYDPYHAWVSLGGVLLSVAGSEALYADLGHFRRLSIQISSTCITYPALILAYLGQGARVLLNPEFAVGNTLWLTTPPSLYWPLIVLATMATIIASQALISASFSIIFQAMTLDCFPRVTVKHTSKKIHGQIYVPVINWVLCVLVLSVVLIFQHSEKLTAGYGVAVSSVMLITELLVSMVMLYVWKLHWTLVATYLIFFGLIDLAYFSSTLIKVAHGGYVPLMIAITLCAVMSCWRWGEGLRQKRTQFGDHLTVEKLFYPLVGKAVSVATVTDAPSTADPDNALPPMMMTAAGADAMPVNSGTSPSLVHLPTRSLLRRTPGVALFFSHTSNPIPPVFHHFVTRFGCVADNVVFVYRRVYAIPTVAEEDRVTIEALPLDGFWRCRIASGYIDAQIAPERLLQELSLHLQVPLSTDNTLATTPLYSSAILPECLLSETSETTFLTKPSTVTFVVGGDKIYAKPSSTRLRRFFIEKVYRPLFASSQRDIYAVPHEQVVEIGMRVRL